MILEINKVGMKIQSVENNVSQVGYRGGIKSLNKINPASYYYDKYFNKMALNSTKNIIPVSPKLKYYTRVVRGHNFSGWDINPSESKDYVLFLHGMSQNVSNYQHLYESVMDKNIGVFALEYRGYGINGEGKISDDKLSKDIERAYQYLTRDRYINPKNITVIGHSMGGALATGFASKHKDLKALILISPVSKISYLGQKFVQNKNLGIGLPEIVQKLVDNVSPVKKLLDMRFNSISNMKKMQVPTYIIQSKNDCVTLKEGTRELIKTARKSGVLKGFKYLALGGHKVDSGKVKTVSDLLDDIYG